MRTVALARWVAAAACALLLVAGPAAAKKDEDANIRTVQGVVSNSEGHAVNGAVVQLKNTKTLQIRSFITRDNGTYYFHGLSTDTDFELSATYSGEASATRTLSSFDSRKVAVMNLKLEPRK
ncbi:MAG TPA: carboxypeptidase-like regulatory domain-containing protein [Bryobacteraceae bacterium]|nr:carboxypeptidase-like regulatory domain-containing protein [Bryobacteraceae bacterium]